MLCKVFLEDYPAYLPLESKLCVNRKHSRIVRSIPCLYLLIPMLPRILDHSQLQGHGYALPAVISDYTCVPLVEGLGLVIALPHHAQTHVSISISGNEVCVRQQIWVLKFKSFPLIIGNSVLWCRLWNIFASALDSLREL